MLHHPRATFTLSCLLALAAGCGPHATAPASSAGTLGNKPVQTVTPPASDTLGWTRATAVTVKDSWAGLGCMHDFTAELTRRGDRFVGTATLEVGRGGPETKQVEVTVGAIRALAGAVVHAAAVPAPNPSGGPFIVNEWTDDYPSGSITFTGPDGSARLFFEDQHRKLMLDRGGEIVPLSDLPAAAPDGGPGLMWTAYAGFLDGPLGLRPWINARCGY